MVKRARQGEKVILSSETTTIMDTIKPLFTATATAVGGRNGRTETSDGVVKADLSVPREMGGPGRPGTATPEHLFAAGYAACFGGALDYVAKQQKREAAKFPGHLSATIFRPAAGARKYTVVLQFDRDENLQNWLRSDRRREWIERVSALEAVPEHREEVTGLEHWFTLPGKPETSPPSRHKMALLLVLAAYP